MTLQLDGDNCRVIVQPATVGTGLVLEVRSGVQGGAVVIDPAEAAALSDYLMDWLERLVDDRLRVTAEREP